MFLVLIFCGKEGIDRYLLSADAGFSKPWVTLRDR